MDAIDKAITLATEQTLTELSNKGIYKRALKEAEGMTLLAEKKFDTYAVNISGELCTIKAPFRNQVQLRFPWICRHIVTAILLLKAHLPEYHEEPIKIETIQEPFTAPKTDTQEVSNVQTDKTLPQSTQSKIKECAENCIKIMSAVFSRGLVRAEESDADNFELAAVSCHALRMAETERQMRELGARLKDCVSRRASFSPQEFAARIFEYADSVNRLTKGDITEEMLGTFRREYSDHMGTVDILPIGTRAISGEYEGCVYYFLNTDRRSPQRFFTYSDLRPTFYEKRSKRFRERATVIWNLDMPLNNYMHTELKLKNAKVSIGHLSSSSKTEITCVEPAQLNCTALREIIISDFAELAKKISETNSDEETDRLYFVHPQECTAFFFDKHTQQQIFDHKGQL